LARPVVQTIWGRWGSQKF